MKLLRRAGTIILCFVIFSLSCFFTTGVLYYKELSSIQNYENSKMLPSDLEKYNVSFQDDETYQNLYNEISKLDKNSEERIRKIVSFYDEACVIVNCPISSINSTQSHGSGVVFYKEIEENCVQYYVLTNEHVVSGNNDFQIITNEATYNGTLMGYSSIFDVAILVFSVSGENSDLINVAPIENSVNVYKADFVMAMGTPISHSYFNSFSEGRISNVYSSEIQHTATLNSGNSGGALFNLDGKIVGLNCSKLTYINAQENILIEGMFFSVSVNAISYSIKEIMPKIY